MPGLERKIDNVLDEIRILVLSVQVLISFLYYATFQKGFTSLSPRMQYLTLGSLVLTLAAFALLLLPVSFHRIVERGRATAAMHRLASKAMTPALVPFALALAIDLFIAATQVVTFGTAIVIGVAAAAVALFAWWGVEAVKKERKGKRDEVKVEEDGGDDGDDGSNLDERIRQVLTEARVILPGAQALLGFAFSAVFSDGFASLATASREAHLVSIVLVTLSIILLVTPASYHRIVEEGGSSEQFHRLAGRLITAAMLPLAAGISLDFFVVVEKVTTSTAVAAVAGAAMLALFLALWFGYSFAKRRSRASRR